MATKSFFTAAPPNSVRRGDGTELGRSQAQRLEEGARESVESRRRCGHRRRCRAGRWGGGGGEAGARNGKTKAKPKPKPEREQNVSSPRKRFRRGVASGEETTPSTDGGKKGEAAVRRAAAGTAIAVAPAARKRGDGRRARDATTSGRTESVPASAAGSADTNRETSEVVGYEV